MEYGICHLGIIPLRNENNHRSEMVSQLLYGDCYKIIEKRKELTSHNTYTSHKMRSIMSPTPAALSALTAICSFNHADRLLREALSQLFIQSSNRQHHSSKPPCRPTPLRSPAACYTTAVFQQRSPASIATAALQQAPSLTDSSDMTDDYR